MQHPNMKSFLDFCENKKPDEEYNYTSAKVCAMAQFMTYETYGYMLRNGHMGDELTDCEYLASKAPYTFGALARRLRERIEIS